MGRPKDPVTKGWAVVDKGVTAMRGVRVLCNTHDEAHTWIGRLLMLAYWNGNETPPDLEIREVVYEYVTAALHRDSPNNSRPIPLWREGTHVDSRASV